MTNHKLCLFIIKKFIPVNINWPREIKIAQKLLKEYPGHSFWNNLNAIKLNSLAWFLTKDGKNFIALQRKIVDLKDIKKSKYIILNHKAGEDKSTCQKPKSVLDFIRSWEENQKKKMQ
jgi:hypothetical protein